jgi:hypothetical protein
MIKGRAFAVHKEQHDPIKCVMRLASDGKQPVGMNILTSVPEFAGQSKVGVFEVALLVVVADAVVAVAVVADAVVAVAVVAVAVVADPSPDPSDSGIVPQNFQPARVWLLSVCHNIVEFDTTLSVGSDEPEYRVPLKVTEKSYPHEPEYRAPLIVRKSYPNSVSK